MKVIGSEGRNGKGNQVKRKERGSAKEGVTLNRLTIKLNTGIMGRTEGRRKSRILECKHLGIDENTDRNEV